MDSETSNRDVSPDPARECQAAMSLGIALLTTRNMDPTQYKLVLAENVIKGPAYAGPHIWQLTFKLKRLIPETIDSKIGAGGELFVEVDLSTHKAKLLGYGE
jgi:hypothetical protein